MEIDYGVPMPKGGKGTGAKRSEEYLVIKKFIESENETMRITYESAEIARKRRSSLGVTVKRENLPVNLIVSGNELYVGKTGEK